MLANYWILGLFVSGPVEPIRGWISDLGARDAPHQALFATLDSVSGLAVVVLAALLWRSLGGSGVVAEEEAAPLGATGRSRALRFGVIALGVAGALTALDGLVPLSCARSLDPSCSLDHDAIDVAHAIESVCTVVATAMSFGFVGRGLGGGGRRTGGAGEHADGGSVRLAQATRILGAAWLLLTALYTAKYVFGDLGATKGLFQRGGQVAFGAWMALLAAPPRSPEAPNP